MVIYDLICKRDHRFEGWFPSYESYQEQTQKKLVSCPTCGTTAVEKIPHALHIQRSDKEKEKKPPQKASPRRFSEADVKQALLWLHHYVRENFEDVGPRFAEEARQVFYGKAQQRPIHGTSSPEEREELDEEGIPYTILPPKPELDS